MLFETIVLSSVLCNVVYGLWLFLGSSLMGSWIISLPSFSCFTSLLCNIFGRLFSGFSFGDVIKIGILFTLVRNECSWMAHFNYLFFPNISKYLLMRTRSGVTIIIHGNEDLWCPSIFQCATLQNCRISL